MTTREMADQVGLDPELVAGFESGAITPSLIPLLELLDALKANLVDLHFAVLAVRERRSLAALVSETAPQAGTDHRQDVRAALIDALERAALRALRVAEDLRSGLLPTSEEELE